MILVELIDLKNWFFFVNQRGKGVIGY